MTDVTPKYTDVSAAENALVGDEAVYAEQHVPEVEVVREDVEAMLPPEPSKPAETVPVNEMYVEMDKVITDPSSPLAVQIPDAGRGDLDLPISVLARGTYDQQVEGDGDYVSRIEVGDGPVSSEAQASEEPAAKRDDE